MILPAQSSHPFTGQISQIIWHHDYLEFPNKSIPSHIPNPFLSRNKSQGNFHGDGALWSRRPFPSPVKWPHKMSVNWAKWGMTGYTVTSDRHHYLFNRERYENHQFYLLQYSLKWIATVNIVIIDFCSFPRHRGPSDGSSGCRRASRNFSRRGRSLSNSYRAPTVPTPPPINRYSRFSSTSVSATRTSKSYELLLLNRSIDTVSSSSCYRTHDTIYRTTTASCSNSLFTNPHN